MVGAAAARARAARERRGELQRARCGSSRSARLIAELTVHLRERRAAQPIAACAQVDQPQRSRAAHRAAAPASACGARRAPARTPRRSATPARPRSCARRPRCHAVFIDSESLPTGIAMPSAGHSSSPTARTVSYSAASSPGSPQAAIQLADSRISRERADVRREDVGDRLGHRQPRRTPAASSTATGVRSPIAIASPAWPW